MADERDVREIENADDVPFSADEIETLAKVHLSAFWPPIRSALLRYQSRALAVIQAHTSTIEEIREAQGRMAMSKQFLDLLETDAPTRYDRSQKTDAQDDDDPS